MARARAWVWLQLLIGWLPVWALYSTLLASAHPESGVHTAILVGFHAILIAALLGLLVHRLTLRLPWRPPVRLRFLAVHLAAALLYAVAWMTLTSLLNAAMVHGSAIQMLRYIPAGYLALGVWLYAMVAGVSYATEAADWELADPAPRERYAPAYVDSFVALPHQTAAFHRGVFPTRLDGLRRDHTVQWNANLAKNFRFHERVNFQMRIDALNVLNRSQMNAPSTDPFSTNFGRVVSQTAAINRWLQVQARVTF